MRAWLAVLMVAGAGIAYATVFTAGPSDYQRALGSLVAGDTLVLRAGVYRQGIALRRLHGTADRRIVIEGPRSGGVAVFLGRPGANTVSLVDASFLTLRDLVFDGAHLPVDAIKAERGTQGVHHIVLERLTIVGHDYAQHVVGISTKCPTWGWVIRDNDIIGAGTGIYLGDSDGSAPFVAGLIEGNLIVDTIGYNLQIKHQGARPQLGGLPEGDSVTVLRSNVFAKTRNASTEVLARPNVLVGHFPLRGSGSDDRYEIADNIFFDNPTEALFQGEGNVSLVRNVFLNARGNAIVLQPHHDVPRRISVKDNLVVSSGRGVSLRGADSGAVHEILQNTIYADEPLQGGAPRKNTVGPFVADFGIGLARWTQIAGLPAAAQLERRVCKVTERNSRRSGRSVASEQHPLCTVMRKLSATAARG
jgi:hypothetical protein